MSDDTPTKPTIVPPSLLENPAPAASGNAQVVPASHASPASTPIADMPTQSLLSGRAGFIVGTIGGLMTVASPFVPPPFSVLVAIVGFLAAAMAGLAARPPSFAVGKPILQGTALTVATAVVSLLINYYPMIPQHGVWQSMALGAAALLCWLTGHAMPPLGSPTPEQLATVQASKDDAIKKIMDGSKAEALDALRKPL